MTTPAADEGREHGLLRPAFPGDTGEADPALTAALAALDGSPVARRRMLATLAAVRVFVPVVAQAVEPQAVELGRSPRGGLATDKHAEMALVTVAGRDGRRALPAFTRAAGLLAWNAEARPVPVEGARAARTAVDDGAVALLLDPGQPASQVVTGSELDQLAAVWTVATGPPAPSAPGEDAAT